MKALAVFSGAMALLLCAYVLMRAGGVLLLAHGDPKLELQAKEVNSITDVGLLQISSESYAHLASTWSVTAGHYMVLFHLTLLLLAAALSVVAWLAWRGSKVKP